MIGRVTSDEGGFQLIELMVVIVILIAVLGGVLFTFTNLQSTTRANAAQNDAQQEARKSLSNIARELRNLASPTDTQPALDRADASDLIFQSVGPGVGSGQSRRVRYCLGSGRVWKQDQTTTTSTVPATATCPASASSGGWNTGVVAAQSVVNGSRPVFTFNSAALTSISEVAVHLYVDTNPGVRPGERSLETGVFLRNQNRAPIAVFSATASGAEIVLDGSSSSDPEGQGLVYSWLEGSSQIGTGPVFHYQPAAGTHSIQLRVTDPAGLTNTATAQSVCLVGVLVSCP